MKAGLYSGVTVHTKAQLYMSYQSRGVVLCVASIRSSTVNSQSQRQLIEMSHLISIATLWTRSITLRSKE